MNTNETLKFFDELDDEDALEAFLQLDAQRSRNPKGHLLKKIETEEQTFIAAQDESKSNFTFTYSASRSVSACGASQFVPMPRR